MPSLTGLRSKLSILKRSIHALVPSRRRRAPPSKPQSLLAELMLRMVGVYLFHDYRAPGHKYVLISELAPLVEEVLRLPTRYEMREQDADMVRQVGDDFADLIRAVVLSG
ncbi:hypothetical protein ANO11243_077880 [Dothideomycetidae sp. 11243]|nr:hypothetical protein ANO11243_077880 [fungal sp. No.11243]